MYPKMLWSEPIKNLLNNIWKVKQELGKPLMDMTLAEMDVFWEGRSFWRKKRIRKFLIFFKFEIVKKRVNLLSI
jgi:hypothetical protein